ncbi:hypothetical protein B7457_20175 [Enterobacter hormaechei subsp. hoffmannii]|nr:hypothetical protein AM429_21690 [Enterobacter cloacae complex sp.]AVU21386.1 hypothetical protein AO413_18030 [Enterobacter cloacae]KJN93700.1 hypothetical protein SS05_06315 [Enterobacter hormaechei subsp. hoffmannii]KJO03374.1 hypothetical protein SS03_12105 [Enterobacter hormaechei subsp. hoffmannii]OWP89408.1 hypothetical protein B7457_20175 [Enterobacter hormaechei subsp. hoffmannii]
MGCKTRQNSGFYLCRQDADARNEHQDDGVSHQEHVRTTPQEGFRMKQSGSRRMRKGHLQEGEREPVRMVGGSGWPGRFRTKPTRQDDVSRKQKVKG